MASALISAGGSLLGGIAGGKGASSAAKAQAAVQQQQLALEQSQYNTLSADATPNINAGNAANQQILRLLGLGDSNTGQSVNGTSYTAAQQQQGALAGITSSPLYQNEYSSGLDALNQSLAATGGLRGGNGALAESNFGSNLFDTLYQQQLSNLGSVVGTGTNALGALGGASSNLVNSSAATSTALGNANATSAASPYAALQQALSGLGSSGLSSALSGTNSTSSFLSNLPSSTSSLLNLSTPSLSTFNANNGW